MEMIFNEPVCRFAIALITYCTVVTFLCLSVALKLSGPRVTLFRKLLLSFATAVVSPPLSIVVFAAGFAYFLNQRADVLSRSHSILVVAMTTFMTILLTWLPLVGWYVFLVNAD